MFGFLIFYFARYGGLPPPNTLDDVAVEMILPVVPQQENRLTFWPTGFV